MTEEMTLTTEDLAAAAKVRPATIIARLSRTGSYFGIEPTKLINGRLLWPRDSLAQLEVSRKQAAA